jgi:predicted nucleotidyltransferase
MRRAAPIGLKEMIEQRQATAQTRQANLWEQARSAAAALRKLGASRIIVFGSLARGEAAPESALDLLAVWDTPLGYWERLRAAHQAIQAAVGMDLVIVTPTEFEQLGPFGDTVAREGVDL